MAFGLNPLVRGRDVGDKVGILVFMGSMVAAAGLLGGLLAAGGLGFSQRLSSALVLGIAALVASLIELKILPLSAPYRKWQVPRDWPARYGRTVGYGMWGGALGVGVLSYIPFASYHVLLIWMFLSGSVLAGIQAGFAYGLGRFLGSVIPGVKMSRHPEATMAFGTLAMSHEEVYRMFQVALLIVVGVIQLTLAKGAAS